MLSISPQSINMQGATCLSASPNGTRNITPTSSLSQQGPDDVQSRAIGRYGLSKCQSTRSVTLIADSSHAVLPFPRALGIAMCASTGVKAPTLERLTQSQPFFIPYQEPPPARSTQHLRTPPRAAKIEGSKKITMNDHLATRRVNDQNKPSHLPSFPTIHATGPLPSFTPCTKLNPALEI
ncbi:hypothetical protein AB1N83_010922 [Pleurotus pulmonarius]